MRFQKQASVTIALLILSMSILLPVAEGEQSTKRTQHNGVPDADGREVQQAANLLGDLYDIKVNKDTWALEPMPQGTFSGSFMPENLFQFDWQIKPHQDLTYDTVEAQTSIKTQTDFHGFTGEGMGSGRRPDDLSEANYDNSVYDPYGMDDMGFTSIRDLCESAPNSDHGGSPNSDCARNSELIQTLPLNTVNYGEDSWRTYISVGVTVNFSHRQIMGGASEFWVRSPIDGVYDPTTSFMAIYEVDSLADNDYNMQLQTVKASTGNASHWEIQGTPPLDKPVRANVNNGTLVYESLFADSEVIMNDYSELGFFHLDNNSNAWANGAANTEVEADGHEAAFGQSCHNVDMGTDGYSTYDFNDGLLSPSFLPFIPCNIYPGNNFMVAPAESEQTQQITSSKHMPVTQDISDGFMEKHPNGVQRTYHRANTFLYPNQPYLFIFYLELLDDDPLWAFTPENIYGEGQETQFITGQFNYANPDQDGDGRPEYIRLPAQHHTDKFTLPADSGLSIIFTQGQSQDMAGYRTHVDNTTLTFFKELPESVLHETGSDGVWGVQCDEIGANCTNDDEMDYVNLYLPFINHDKKKLTIEYIAYAYEETDNGFKFRPWFDSLDANPAIRAFNTSGYGDQYTSSPRYNFYYSGFSYQGADVTDFMPSGYNEDMIQNNLRPQSMNDAYQANEPYKLESNQHLNYFMHTSELVPANGTTHILYMIKLAGHHHWQGNLENSRYLADEDDGHERYGQGIYNTPHFTSLLDSDNDGRTDNSQQNSTDITFLIHNSHDFMSEVPLALPLWPTGMGGGDFDSECTIVSCSTYADMFDIMAGDAIPIGDLNNEDELTYLFPNIYPATTSGFTIHDEDWDRAGYRVDGARTQSLFGYQGEDIPCLNNGYSGTYNILLYCDNSHTLGPLWVGGLGIDGVPSLPYQAIQGISWHQAKLIHYADGAEALGDGRAFTAPQHGFGIFEVNGRGASYIQPHSYSKHNTELFSSVSLVNGRFTEVKNIDGVGFTFLDNAFPKRIIIENNLEITIVAKSEWVESEKSCGDFSDDADSNDLCQLSVDIYDGVNYVVDEYGDEAEMVYDALVYGKDKLVETAQGIWDGSITMDTLYQDLTNAIMPMLTKFGELMWQGMIYLFGEILQLFAEWGLHLDEIGLGLLHVFMYITAFWFVRFILRLASTIIIKIQGVEQY